MSWHLLEKILDEVSKQSTLVGKVWITLLFVFRIIAITRIGDTIYADEQAAFKCNSRQPGCENVCFNDFSPISHVRFWGFQTIIVATPPVIFIIYAAHIVGKLGHYKLTGRHVELDKRKKKEASHHKDEFKKKSISNETILPKKHFPNSKYPISNKIPKHPEVDQRLSEMVNADVILRTYSQSQEQPPPSYNEYPSNFCEEVDFNKITSMPYYPPTTDRFPFSRSSSFKRLSKFCRQISLNQIQRRYSYDLPASTRKVTSPPVSASTQDLSFRNDVTPRNYTVAKECGLEEVMEPNYPWGSGEINKTYKRSDQDSAFSENGSATNSFSNLYQTVQLKTPQSYSTVPYSPKLTKTSAKFPMSRLTSSHGITFSAPGGYNNFENTISQSNYAQNPLKSSMKQKQPTTPVTAKKRCRTFTPGYSGSSSVFKSPKIQAFVKRMESHIGIAYFMQCFFRILLELCFLMLQYYLFQFDVPELYRCNRWPCPNTVDCFVSRPREKETMLMFMFGISVLCIALSCYEIFLLIYHRTNDFHKSRKLKKDLQKVVIYGKEGGNVVIKGNVKQKILEEEAKKKLLLYGDTTSSSEATTSSSDDSDNDDGQASLNSEELSDMFENEVEDIGDFQDAGNDQENEMGT